MPRLNVRRMTAIDMYGTAGTERRRRVIVVEFFASVVLCAGVGILLLSVGGAAGQLLGGWLLGVSVNYLALTCHAVPLLRHCRLDSELADVNIPGERRFYSPAQFCIAIPLAIAMLALAQSPWPGRSAAGEPPG